MDKTQENTFYKLIGLQLSGAASQEDLMLLEEILLAHPELRFFHDQVLKPEPSPTVTGAQMAEQAYATHYINKIHNTLEDPVTRVQKQVKPQRTRYLLRYMSAACLLVAVLMFLFLSNRSKDKPTRNEMVTEIGSRSKLTLPDGSLVILNSGSKVSYDENFGGTIREVFLSGEAYFDVVHKEHQPFVIHTGTGSIRVLGTAFNVRSYDNEPVFETTLIRGKVEVLLKNGSKNKIMLAPGQKITVLKEKGAPRTDALEAAPSFKVMPVVLQDSLIPEISWVTGQMVFINKPLQEIAHDLERQFGTKIIFLSDKTKDYRYTGVYDGADLSELLEILSLSKKIQYEYSKNEVLIH